MPIDADTYKNVMSQFASGVTIVTVQHEGQQHGLTASSFTSLSLDPPLVLICVGKGLYSHQLIEQSQAFAVNILGTEQQEWGMRFANPRVEDRYAGIDWTTAQTGSPILPGCLAWVDCKLHQVHDGGDHTIFIGEVVAGSAPPAGEANGSAPLLYYNRAWRSLAEEG